MQRIKKLSFIALSSICFLTTSAHLLYAQDDTEPAQEKKVMLVGNITALGSYSKICGGSDLSGLYATGNLAPIVKLNSSDYLIPLYNVLYRQQRQIINEEEGGRVYTKILNHNVSVMHKHLYSEKLTQRLTGFFTLNYNKETSDESFGDGLYDYRDYGGFADYQYKIIKTETDTGTILFGGKYYFRKYPNFTSLIALALQTAPEEDEKDQHVWGPTTRYTHKFADKLILSISYDYLHKEFTDKHTIDENGILDDGKREDDVHYIKLEGNYKINERLTFNLEGDIELNNSNQNYYDSMNTPLFLPDDIFVPHYYDYDFYQVKPGITYLFPLSEEKDITLKVAYAYGFRDYPNRSIRNNVGLYQEETQEDEIHSGYVSVSVPITKKLSFLFMGDYTHTESNMDFEQFYRYNYNIYHLLSGLSYKF
ncbi:MAG: hypothetical protein JW869_08110 [Candidatus Omnitrophica bacterium]|nr:hypothetical protein [Candidatus Omnitrophota bacterium]